MNAGWVEIVAGDGHRFRAWRSAPLEAARGAVVVIQEVFGANAHIRGVADAWASRGFVALAPDLFGRVAPGTELGYDDESLAQGRALVARLGFDDPLRDVAACIATLAPEAPVGVVGFCWGGTVAFLAGTRLKCPAVSYYGGRTLPFLHERPGAPLMLHFGARDPIIPADARARIVAAVPDAQVHVYDAGHGFNCEARKDHDPQAAALAFERSVAFLATALTP